MKKVSISTKKSRSRAEGKREIRRRENALFNSACNAATACAVYGSGNGNGRIADISAQEYFDFCAENGVRPRKIVTTA